MMKIQKLHVLRKLTVVFCSSFFLSSSYGRAPGTFSQAKSELQRTSVQDIVGLVNQLVKVSAPSRMIGTSGHSSVEKWLTQQIQKLDPKGSGKFSVQEFSPDITEARRFYQHDFDTKILGKFPKNSPEFKRWLGFTQNIQNFAEKNKNTLGHNLIWEKPGIDPTKTLVITAHFDTISHDKETFLIKENEPTPGANYNATGVCLALGFIKTLAQIDLNYSVQVVFLDWQAAGFLGSFHHAKTLSAKQILGVINLEMLGQDTTYFDKTATLGNMKAYTSNGANDVKFANSLIGMGQKIPLSVSFTLEPRNFDNSDNFRYSDSGLAAVTFSQNWEEDFNPKFYQTSLDTPETLNHKTLYEGFLFIGGAVLGTLLDLTK